MKITAAKTYMFSVPTGQEICDPGTGELICSTKKTWLNLKLETDAGISGWGDGSGAWLGPPVQAMLKQLEVLLIGSDPLKVEALTADICDRSPWKAGPIMGTAVAAINMALYDIAGKSWGVPVHLILGGKRRDRVQVYASGGLVESSPEEAAKIAQEHVANGYSGVKGNPLESRSGPLDMGAIERSLECIAAVRAAIGPQGDIPPKKWTRSSGKSG